MVVPLEKAVILSLPDNGNIERVLEEFERAASLTSLERRLTQTLVRQYPLVCTKEELLRKIWGFEPIRSQNIIASGFYLVKCHVSHLRKKLEESTPSFADVNSLRGFGYWIDIHTLEGKGRLAALKSAPPHYAKSAAQVGQIFWLNNKTLGKTHASIFYLLFNEPGKVVSALDAKQGGVFGDFSLHVSYLRKTLSLGINGYFYVIRTVRERGYVAEIIKLP